MRKRKYTSQLTCADCKREVAGAHPQQTKCVVCRLIANITWLGTSRTDRCTQCEGRYARLKRNERHCGMCCKRDGFTAVAECAFCERHGPVYHEDIHVCPLCIYEPRHRETLLRSLLRKQTEYTNQESIPVPA